MSLEKKWNGIINKRERRKELEKLLSSVKENITFAKINVDEEDNHSDSRLAVMLQDLKVIESELDRLDNIEEEYQQVLAERIDFICDNDEKASQFLYGVEKAITQLEKELTVFNNQSGLLHSLKKRAEVLLKDLKNCDFSKDKVKDFVNECDSILCSKFGNKPNRGPGKGIQINELYLWELYRSIDELDTGIKEKMQMLIPQMVELNMRREEYLDNYSKDE